MNRVKVFLGGTCSSQWRDKFIPLMDMNKFDLYNPIVDDWTEECYQNELIAKRDSEVGLFVITPKIEGVYSIFEVCSEAHKYQFLSNKKIIFCCLDNDDGKTFNEGMQRGFDRIKRELAALGVVICDSLEEVVAFLNQYYKSHVSDKKWVL